MACRLELPPRVLGFREVGIPAERLLEGFGGFFVAPQRLERQPEMVMDARVDDCIARGGQGHAAPKLHQRGKVGVREKCCANH